MEATPTNATTSSTTVTSTVIMPASESAASGSTPDGSAGPVVVQDTSVRVVESVKSRVETNKTVVQRTSNTNAVQVNKYDAEGNLKSTDIESTSWEDRDTQCYQWSNQDQPPPEALAPPPTDDRIEQFFNAADHHHHHHQQQQQQLGGSGDQSALVLASTGRRDVPAVSWSGTAASHQVDETAGREQHTTTKLDGSQWSRSGEAVWISSGPVVPPFTSSKTLAIDAANGPAAPAAGAAAAGGPTVEERRRRRCQENRSRKAAAGSTAASTVRVRPSSTEQ